MTTRKKATKSTGRSTRRRTAGRLTAAVGAPASNGLTTFSMHAYEKASGPAMAALRSESVAHPGFAIAGAASPAEVDPETAAQRYLKQALDSAAVPAFTAPKSDAGESTFKTLGTETIPLTGTKTVKFRQVFNSIPVYGSLVTVELDDGNDLLSINSALGGPVDVKPVAKISPAQAIAAAEQHPGFRKQLAGIVPRLQYYFDRQAGKWRLVFILEDVPVTATEKKKDKTALSPRFMDYVVDAHTGKVVAELPRTPSLAAAVETAVDGRGKSRQIRVEVVGSKRLLQDTELNIQTFDAKFSDPIVNEAGLPGAAFRRPPKWKPSAVSAHANAAVVAEFLRNVMRRNNIDNNGGPMNSSVNCVVADESDDGRQWFNAFWNGTQMVYGQRLDGTKLMSLAVALDIVAHEMFHGVTDATSRLEYSNQSGALNESYSDIFGVTIANFDNPDPRSWNWKVGEGLSPDGEPFRDMSDPTLFGQPAHMHDFKVLPNTQKGDWGGVHTNSGIHNKAAFKVFTAKNTAGNLVLTPTEVAAVFYLTLTQQLSRTSGFSDSRRGALTSARTLFRNLPTAEQNGKLAAIAAGFTAVGIS